MRWREEDIDGRGVRMHVRRVVEPIAPPVMLLHGLGVGGAIWQSFARRLLPHLAAVAPDLRGHGKSDAPPHGYEPLDYATDLVELLSQLGGMPIVGHSLGALVALETAALRPERVPWIALLDPPLDPLGRSSDVGEVYRLRHAPPGELEAYLRGSSAELLAPLFRQATDAAFEAMLARTGRAIPKVDQPVLVLQADPRAGGILGDEAAARLRQTLPRMTLKKIEGATHALHASHPAEVAAAILAFAGYPSVASSPSR